MNLCTRKEVLGTSYNFSTFRRGRSDYRSRSSKVDRIAWRLASASIRWNPSIHRPLTVRNGEQLLYWMVTIWNLVWDRTCRLPGRLCATSYWDAENAESRNAGHENVIEESRNLWCYKWDCRCKLRVRNCTGEGKLGIDSQLGLAITFLQCCDFNSVFVQLLGEVRLIWAP